MVEMSSRAFVAAASREKIGWAMTTEGRRLCTVREQGGSEDDDVVADVRFGESEAKTVRLTPQTLLGELFLSLVVSAQ